MANEFIIKNGFQSRGDSEITGSLNVSGSGISFIASGGTVFNISETGLFTLGEGATATLDSQVAIGKDANAGSSFDIAIGNNADANNGYSIAIGKYATSYNQGIAIGFNNAAGTGGIVMGHQARSYHTSQAAEVYGIAIGYNSDSTTRGVAIGYNAQIPNEEESIAIGANASSSGANSITLNSSGVATLAHKANAFGVYLTDANPVFEIEATGSTTLSGSNLVLTNNISGSSTSTASFGTYLGDGSQLTNLPSTSPFPFTGDAQITGSLTISGSFHSFTLDSDNIVLGAGAGASMLAGADNNVILGTAAGNSLTTGDNNTLIGSGSGGSLTTTSQNTFIGANSGHQNSGQYQVAIGQSAARYGNGTSAQYNVAIGRSALQGRNSAAQPSYTVAIGASAGFYNYLGTQNTFVGYQAGYGNTSDAASGNNNVGIGPNTLYRFGSGADSNIAIGENTGEYIQQGSNNILIGSGSYGTGDISNQLKIGNQLSPIISASLATGDVIFYNTASAPNFSGSFQGDGSALTNLPSTSPFPFQGDASITGSLTVSGSFNAFRLNTQNVVLGQDAGFSTNVNGPRNVFVGYQAAYTNTIGDDNVCIGRAAGYALSTNASDGNIFIGSLAGAGGTSPAARMSDANNNIGIGYEALLYLTSGDQNIGMGVRTLRNISTGKYNYAYGDGALYNTNSGQDNIGIGYQAGYNQTTGNGNITIGSGSLGIAEESNQLRIGHGDNHIISGSLETGHILLQTTTISGSLLNTGTVSLNNTDSPYTLTGTQQFILIDPSGGDVTINMPDAATYPGREIRFKLTQAAGANTVTLQRQGADTIDGATTYTDLDIQYESISTVSNGSNGWFIF